MTAITARVLYGGHYWGLCCPVCLWQYHLSLKMFCSHQHPAAPSVWCWVSNGLGNHTIHGSSPRGTTRGTPTTAYIRIWDCWDLGFFWRVIMLRMMKSSMPLSCPPVPQIKNQSSTTGTPSLRPVPPCSGTDCPGADWCLHPGLGIDPPGVRPSFHQKDAQMLHMQWAEAKHQRATFWHDGWRKFSEVGSAHDLIFPLLFIHIIVNVAPGRLKIWVPTDRHYNVLM